MISQNMNNIIIYGAGRNLRRIISVIEKSNRFSVIEIWDKDINKWNNNVLINQKKVYIKKPHKLKQGTIIISSTIYEDEIKNELIKKYGIKREKIKSIYYILEDEKEDIISKYKTSGDIEINEIVNYLYNNELQMYNGIWTEKYCMDKCFFDIHMDKNTELYYSFWKGKKIFLSRKITDIQSAKYLLMQLAKEQDFLSPHRYIQEGHCFKNDDIILDCGAAEGFFSLEHIDEVEKVILVESDWSWVEALQYTFMPYKDKVIIIPKMLGNIVDEKNITVDEICRHNKVSFIKMDIEGGESNAISGARYTLKTTDNIEIAICTYHKGTDAETFEKLFSELGYQTEFTKGYIYLPFNAHCKNELRRGVLLAKRKVKRDT